MTWVVMASSISKPTHQYVGSDSTAGGLAAAAPDHHPVASARCWRLQDRPRWTAWQRLWSSHNGGAIVLAFSTTVRRHRYILSHTCWMDIIALSSCSSVLSLLKVLIFRWSSGPNCSAMPPDQGASSPGPAYNPTTAPQTVCRGGTILCSLTDGSLLLIFFASDMQRCTTDATQRQLVGRCDLAARKSIQAVRRHTHNCSKAILRLFGSIAF